MTPTLPPGRSDHFSRQNLRRISHVTERQLTAWQKVGLLPQRPAYSFSDLIALKTIKKLRENRVSLNRIRHSLEALRQKLAAVEHPLTELKISSDGRRILVGYEGTTMEPISGQLLFNFETKSLGATVRAMRPAQPAEAAVPNESANRQEAETWFVRGLRLEENPDTVEQALEAYKKAISLNPDAAGAFINLGTLYYNLHRLAEAEDCYRRASQIDPQYALAFFNLGNVYDERGNLEEAKRYYEDAIRIQNDYGDAHYNLALVLEKMGHRGKAIPHWRRYLKADPGSPWAAYARQQLSQAPFPVAPK